MKVMAMAPTDISGGAVLARRRGKSKASNFTYDGPVSVIRLELDLTDERVPKTLAQRTHDCPHGGPHGDRDIASAVLAACVQFADPDDPHTARVDYRLAHALRAGLVSQQEWEGSVNRHQPPTSPDGVGSARTGSHPAVASAEQAALDPRPNRPGPQPGRCGTNRKQPVPILIGAASPITGQLLVKDVADAEASATLQSIFSRMSRRIKTRR
jgi:hypothetical protein